jgi:hypothetical protein
VYVHVISTRVRKLYSLYWLLRTSVRERDALGLRHPPLSLFQVVLSHRSRRKMFLMHKRKQACVCSKPSGKACKGCMRGLPKTSAGMRLRVGGRGPPAERSHT